MGSTVEQNIGGGVRPDIAGHVLTFRHDAAGQELTRTLGDHLRLAHTWDPTGRLTSQSLTTAATGTLPSPTGAVGAGGPAAAEAPRVLRRDYTYRPDGNLTAIDDSHTGRRTFDLDRAGRVTAVHATNWTETYAYDEAGNQTHATWPDRHPNASARGHRTYTGTNITRAGRIRYEHDELGRVTLRQKTRVSRKPDTWRYSWNAEGRLTTVITPDGTAWRYLYDPFARRISKHRFAADGQSVVEETTSTWDGTTLTEQATRISAAREEITLTWDQDGLAPLSQTERKTAIPNLPHDSQQSIDQRFFAIVSDLVGTPTDLIDPSGTVAWHASTSLWGDTTWDSKATAYTPLRSPGQYFDPETQLHYNVHRHYDPATARYLTLDPLGLNPAPNPASYVRNPHTWTDPLGLAPDACTAGSAGKSGLPGETVEATPEIVAPKPLKPKQAWDAINDFLGPSEHTNTHPRTGDPDPHRLVSEDGQRSIRIGPHEMNSKSTKFHFHMEKWNFISPMNKWIIDNTMVRVPLGLK